MGATGATVAGLGAGAAPVLLGDAPAGREEDPEAGVDPGFAAVAAGLAAGALWAPVACVAAGLGVVLGVFMSLNGGSFSEKIIPVPE